MKFGIAGIFPDNQDRIRCMAKIGYNFVESGLTALHDNYSDEQVKEFADLLNELNMPCISTNCMFPGDIRLIGKDVDRARIENYLHEAYSRIAPLKTKVCVLGSGGARTIAPDADVDRAYEEFEQLIAEVIAPITEQYGKVLAIEPLNYSECNIVNTVADSIRVVRTVNLPSVRTLIDFYHVRYNGEDIESFVEYGKYIEHVHVASFNNHRRFPAPYDGEDYRGFFEVLRRAGYQNENISIESGVSGKSIIEFENSALAAYDLLRA